MKAKRILSLLVTVSSIAAFGLTTLAAPTGYDTYVKSGTNQILSEGQTLYTGAVMPVLDGDDAIRADVTPVNLTDAEVSEMFGATPQDMGCPADWTDATYLVNVDAKNLGTLAAKRTGATAALYKYNGFKMGLFSLNFSYNADEVICVGALSSALNEDITASVFAGNGFVSETEYKFEYSDGTAKGGFPADNSGTMANAEVEGAASVMFFAKPGSVVTLSNGYAMYYNYNNSKAQDATGADWSNTTVAYWHPATVTLGESAPEEPEVPETKTVGAKAKMNAPKRFADIQGVLVTATNKAGNAGEALVKKADIFGEVAELNAEVVMGLNINNVPADEELTGVTMAWAY